MQVCSQSVILPSLESVLPSRPAPARECPAPVFRQGLKRQTPQIRSRQYAKVWNSEASLPTPYTAPEAVVRAAPASEVLTALRLAQCQCAVSRGYPAGGALWYYMSLVHFPEEVVPLDVREDEETAEVVTQALLRDLYTASLDEIEERCQSELALVESLITELRAAHPARVEETVNDGERILSMVKFRPLSAERNDFLQTMERKRLERIPADACAVCGGGESLPPDDWIVICSGCEVAVHMKCFGLLTLPENDWFCDVCKANAKNVVCGLCNRSGGILKPTIHNRDWPSTGSREPMWVHLYCALTLGANFLLGESRSLIDLTPLHKAAWERVCSYCRQVGACVACTVCQAPFHPECWRRLASPPWIRTQQLCRRHSNQISIDSILFAERCVVHEVRVFCSILSRQGAGRVKRRRSASEEAPEGILRLVQRYLRGVNSLQNHGFVITVTSGAVKVEMPEAFNVVAPEVVQSEGLVVEGKTAEESYWQYVALYPSLLHRLKKPKVELTLKELSELTSCQRLVTKKRRLIQRRTRESLDTVVRLPLSFLKESEGVSTSSTQDVSEDDTEDAPKL